MLKASRTVFYPIWFRLYRVFLLLSFLIPFSIYSHSSLECPGDGCSLTQLYHEALNFGETTAIFNEKVVQAKERYRASYGLYLPELDLSVVHNYRHLDGEGRWYKPWISAKIRQRILNGLDQFTEVNRYEHLKKQAEFLKKNDALLRFEETARLYYSYLEKERRIENINHALELSSRYLAILSHRKRLGRSRVSDLLREKALVAKLEAERESHIHDLKILTQEISFLTGISPDKLRLKRLNSVDVVTTAPSLDDALASLEARPDILAALEYKRAASDERISMATGDFFPDIYLQGEYYFIREPYSTSSSPAAYGKNNDWYVQLGIEIPIFYGGSRYFKHKEYRSREREAAFIYKYEIRRAQSDLRVAFEELQGLIQELKNYKESRDIAEKYQDALTTEYRRGMVTGLEMVRSRLDLLDANEIYEITRYKLALANVRFYILSGKIDQFLDDPAVLPGNSSKSERIEP